MIYLIHYQLADDAIVTESKFLHDREAKKDREVDIVIETQVGGHPIIISIECQGTNLNKDTYAIFKMEFPVPNGTYFIDTSNVRRKISSLLIIGHSNRETELVDLEEGSFGSAQIAFGKTKVIDEKSLITLVEREDRPNTAAIMLPSDDNDTIDIVDLREAKRN